MTALAMVGLSGKMLAIALLITVVLAIGIAMVLTIALSRR
jgi:hypothetical protein